MQPYWFRAPERAADLLRGLRCCTATWVSGAVVENRRAGPRRARSLTPWQRCGDDWPVNTGTDGDLHMNADVAMGCPRHWNGARHVFRQASGELSGRP